MKKSLQRIYNTDCMDFMSSYSGKKFDVIVTSPPYNVNKKYNIYLDNLTLVDYLKWVELWGGAL